MGKSCSKGQGVNEFHVVEGIVNPRLGPEGQCHATTREIIELSYCPDVTGVADTPCKLSRTASTSLILSNSFNQSQELAERTAGSGLNESDVQESESDFMDLKKMALLRECDLVVDLPPEGCDADAIFEKESDILECNCSPPLPTTPISIEEKGKEVDTRSLASIAATSNKDEWSYNLYDFEGKGKVTDQDLSQLMRSICTVVGQAVDKKSCYPDNENKMLKVRLSVAQHKKYDDELTYHKDELKRENRSSKSSVRNEAKLLRNHNELPNGFSRMIFPPPNTEEALKLSHYIEERLSMHTDRCRWKEESRSTESLDTQSEIVSNRQREDSRSTGSPDNRSDKSTDRTRWRVDSRSRESLGDQSEKSRLRNRFRPTRSGTDYKNLRGQDNISDCGSVETSVETPPRISRPRSSRSNSTRCSPTSSNSETLDKSVYMLPKRPDVYACAKPPEYTKNNNFRYSPANSNGDTLNKLYVLPKRQDTYGGSADCDTASPLLPSEQCIPRRENRHRKGMHNVTQQQSRGRTCSEKNKSRATDFCQKENLPENLHFQNNNDRLQKDVNHKNDCSETQKEPIVRKCPCRQRPVKLSGRACMESPVINKKCDKSECLDTADRCHHKTDMCKSNPTSCCHCKSTGTCKNGCNCETCTHRQTMLPFDCVHRHEHYHYHYYVPQQR